MDLALALHMAPRDVIARHTSAELTEWAAYFKIDPQGQARADLRAGIIASTIGNVNRAKGGEPFKPTDFMPYRREDRKPKPRTKKSLVAEIKARFANFLTED